MEAADELYPIIVLATISLTAMAPSGGERGTIKTTEQQLLEPQSEKVMLSY
jgi:hypothetical protein